MDKFITKRTVTSSTKEDDLKQILNTKLLLLAMAYINNDGLMYSDSIENIAITPRAYISSTYIWRLC